jgi:hypothetical protein
VAGGNGGGVLFETSLLFGMFFVISISISKQGVCLIDFE